MTLNHIETVARSLSQTGQVAAIDAYPLRLAYNEPIQDSRSIIRRKSTVLVRVKTSQGVVGWGEAAAFGDVAFEVAGLINSRLAPLVAGFSAAPRDCAARLRRETAHFGQKGMVLSALSGIELALWDALGLASGLAVSELLGSFPRPVRMYAGTGYYVHGASPKDNLSSLRRQFLDIRADVLRLSGAKIKIGLSGLDDDIERVSVARQVLGTDSLLIADANNAFALHEALQFARRAESANLCFLEEPIPFDQPKASSRLRSQSPIRIAGYEFEMGLGGFQQHIDECAVDIVQPDCIWTGGLLECLEIAKAAERAGILVSPHNFASPISTAANYHFLCLTPCDLLEVDGTESPLNRIEFERDNRVFAGGKMEICGPGLGLTPNLESVLDLSELSRRS